MHHRAEVGRVRVQVIQPCVIARRLRRAPQIPVILHGDESAVELGCEDLIRVGDGSEDLRPRERACVEAGPRASSALLMTQD